MAYLEFFQNITFGNKILPEEKRTKWNQKAGFFPLYIFKNIEN